MEHKEHLIKNCLRKCFREEFKSPTFQKDCLNLNYEAIVHSDSIFTLPKTS